ncbi:MAG: Cna B-type domain-containing protein [Oscillospiraceae bacterium]|nr:Cna B-type domain-containing protein [Oscillospiraceae bacterium]
MRKEERQKILQYAKLSRYRSAWRKFVRAMACVVVFCTTYALILPAITMEQQYFCGLEAHAHTEDCYEQRETLRFTCVPAEGELHLHEELCFHPQGQQLCPYIENPGHSHSEGCYEGETLICTEPQLPVHVHGDACILREQEAVLICTREVHVHEDACSADPEADLETREDWEASLNRVVLTGDWAKDLTAVAESQIGYRESTRNYLMENGIRKGYTRYGAWYGVPYGRWDAMFVSFCLHYAGIPEEAVPYQSNSKVWYENLKTNGRVDTLSDGQVAPGDVAFLTDGTGEDVTAAIVSQAQWGEADNGEPQLYLQILTGDTGTEAGEVAETHITVPQSDLLGFVSMEKARAAYDVLHPEPVSEEIPVGEADASAQTTAPTETTVPTEPAAPRRITRTAETENYIVAVSYDADLVLPEGAELRVMEYSKDSELYYQRCVQAGYELEWLLNIGFFLGEEEIEVRGGFDVVVTGKQGQSLGSDVTHFADGGPERIDGQAVTEDGQAAVAFTSDTFSDFGGGVALAAEDAPAVLAQTANVTLNFTSWSEWNPITFPSGNHYTCDVGSTITIVLGDVNANYLEPQIIVDGGELVSATYTCGEPGHTHGWCGTDPRHTFVVRATTSNVTITARVEGAGWSNNSVTVSSGGSTPEPSETTQPTTEPEDSGSDYPERPGYPEAVHIGSVDLTRLRFYNICEDGNNGVSALAGCVFEIVGENGYYATVTSTDQPEVNLPADIPDGEYTITEISAPAGYMRDTNYQRTFTVQNHALVSDGTIGTFINHDTHQLNAKKTGEVEDYNNRIYQILLSAENHMRMYEMDPVDVLFVVDQSNSMLFPSGLNDTGKRVNLQLNGQNNVRNMDNLGLDRNQVYYIISDPHGSSTVWAVWHNGQTWMYQDASYYAKAWHDNGVGYQDPNETAIFPSNRSYQDQADREDGEHGGRNVRANGGGLGHALNGSGLGKYIDTLNYDVGTFAIYTASGEFNRLHYLEEALTNMIYTLADVNDQNRVTITEFCSKIGYDVGPLTLSPDNVEELVYVVQHINTGGGTRQDIALKHVYDNHLNNANEHYSGNPENTYTILVTDGAPVLSSGSEIDNLGSPNDAASTTANSVYAQIKGYAQQVREKSTLMTVGLGMDDVEGGKQVLQQIATNGNFNCALDDAAELIDQMQRIMFDAFRPKELIEIRSDVVDEISDSFYPIAYTAPGAGAATGRRVLVQDGARDWIQLQSGDWITLDGGYTTAGAADAAGQLLRKEDGTYYIRWDDIDVSNPYANLDEQGIAWVQQGQGSATGRTVLGTYGGRDWIQLNSGDWITQEGQYYAGTPDYWGKFSHGQANRNADGTFSVAWGNWANGNNRALVDLTRLFDGWDGTFYVKAKEDFIGGNAIHTNKTAFITADALVDDKPSVTVEFDKPTVNVHLLDMNEMQSEVTVYLGDLVNEEGHAPLDSLKYFYDNTAITKLIAGSDNTTNDFGSVTVTPEGTVLADGLEEAHFYLRYALDYDLTQAQWETLVSGEAITIPYIYDNPSSRGPVGEFTFRLEKTGMAGANPDYAGHEATAACQPGGLPLTHNCDAPAETYTLYVTYEAYGLGESGRPGNNAHNGSGSPGTEVGTGTTLPTGLGTVEKENVHEVHVISGAIKISKKFETGLTDLTDRTFTFLLHRVEDGEDTSRDVSKTITILMGESTGSTTITFDGLRRGTYTVTEAPDEKYTTGAISVLSSTNCYSEPAIGGSDVTVTFVMGNNTVNENVIGYENESDAYTSYIDPVNGVFGEAEFTNREIVYKGDIPVEKVWDDGSQMHDPDAVYLVLYLDGVPVQDADGNHRLLRLDKANNWKDTFEVILADEHDKVTNYDYSVREVSQVSADERYQDTWHKAILENDGSALYYAKALEDGSILGVGSRGYMVHYTPGDNGAWTVTNNRAVELPSTGGMGTHLYTFSGLLMMMAALMYGCSRRRKRERGAGQ